MAPTIKSVMQIPQFDPSQCRTRSPPHAGHAAGFTTRPHPKPPSPPQDDRGYCPDGSLGNAPAADRTRAGLSAAVGGPRGKPTRKRFRVRPCRGRSAPRALGAWLQAGRLSRPAIRSALEAGKAFAAAESAARVPLVCARARALLRVEAPLSRPCAGGRPGRRAAPSSLRPSTRRLSDCRPARRLPRDLRADAAPLPSRVASI